MNAVEDEFFRDTQHLVFGELGSALKSIVDQFQTNETAAVALAGGKSRLNTIGDIQRFMENLSLIHI